MNRFDFSYAITAIMSVCMLFSCGSSQDENGYPVVEITRGLKAAVNRYADCRGVHNGFVIVQDAKERCGLIDSDGREVIPCKYDYIEYFDGCYYEAGYMGVINDDLYGIYDIERQQEILPTAYGSMTLVQTQSVRQWNCLILHQFFLS